MVWSYISVLIIALAITVDADTPIRKFVGRHKTRTPPITTTTTTLPPPSPTQLTSTTTVTNSPQIGIQALVNTNTNTNISANPAININNFYGSGTKTATKDSVAEAVKQILEEQKEKHEKELDRILQDEEKKRSGDKTLSIVLLILAAVFLIIVASCYYMCNCYGQKKVVAGNHV